MIAAQPLSQAEREAQAQREWEAWQAAQRIRREAKGYNKPVSDDEALDVLGLLG